MRRAEVPLKCGIQLPGVLLLMIFCQSSKCKFLGRVSPGGVQKKKKLFDLLRFL